jgi:hypothetical protein
MKIEVKGKRFSRHADVVPENPIELLALLSTGGISESVRVATGMAVEILKSRGLPHTALIFWDEAEKAWKSEAPQDDVGRRRKYLWRHLEAMGFDRDSVEGLCGAVIEAAFHWEKADRDTIREGQAFRVGLFYGLLRAYTIEAAGNQSNAQADRRKKWAVAFAEKLVESSPDASFSELWESITEEDYGPIFREGDRLNYFPEGDGFESLAKDTFRRQYIDRLKRDRTKSISRS